MSNFSLSDPLSDPLLRQRWHLLDHGRLSLQPLRELARTLGTVVSDHILILVVQHLL